MGLTIHYSLRTCLTKTSQVRDLLESIRQVALDLPFKEVGELVEFKGMDADIKYGTKEDPHRWLKIQAQKSSAEGYPVSPLHIVGFSTWPGEGCEPANFGFCRFPAFIEVQADMGRRKKLATKLNGWSWGSFCKTQYASDPECGGVENFLSCHLCVIKLLDFVQKTSLVNLEVSDEGGYWQDRDLTKLAREVGRWNEFIAAFAGVIKDEGAKQGVVVESAIAGFANFEHLEAKGMERLRKLLDGRSKKDR